MLHYRQFHPSCQFGWIDPHRLKECFSVILPQESLRFLFQVILINDWDKRIGHRAFLVVPPVVHANIVDFQVTQFAIQISTASNHKPLVRRLGFIVMVAVFIMDNERSIHNYIKFYVRAREVRHIDEL